MVSEITLSDILKHLRLDSVTTYSYGAQVNLTTITAFRANKEYRTELKAETPSESNHRSRVHVIREMMVNIHQDLQTIQLDPVGTSHSLVFYTLFTQIRKLSECRECSEKRTLVVVSDLQQNGPEFSILKNADWLLLSTKPEAIEYGLDTMYHLDPELTNGIRVVFAHRPGTMRDDDRFHVIAKFLETYLSKKGVVVETRTSFN